MFTNIADAYALAMLVMNCFNTPEVTPIILRNSRGASLVSICGYAFVEMESSLQAERAMRALNGKRCTSSFAPTLQALAVYTNTCSLLWQWL